MDLANIFKLLFRRVWYLIGIPLGVVIITLIATSDYKQVFKSTAQLSTGYTISQEVDQSNNRFNVYETDVKFSNLIETMNSSRVLSLLSYRLILHDLDSIGKPFTVPSLDKEEDKVFYSQLDFSKLRATYEDKIDSMLILNTYNESEKNAQKLLELFGYDYESLKSAITVRRVRNTDYVSVMAITESPFLSAYAVNTLCEEFMRFSSSLSTKKTSNAIETYAKLLQEKRKELDEASTALQRYKSSARTVNLELERESQLSRVSELQLELQRERQGVNAINVQLNDIRRRLGAGTKSGITNSDIVAIRSKINKVNERYRASGSSDPVLRDSLRTLRETQQRYIRIMSQSTNSSNEDLLQERSRLEVDRQIAEQNIIDLEGLIRSASSNAGGFASKEARISQLERELTLAGEEYKEAQEKYNLALNVSITSSNSFDQILLGLPASKPESSKRLIISGVSGASTFVVIVLIFLLLEYVDISIKNTSNFQKLIDLKLIGVVGHMNLRSENISELFLDEEKEEKKPFLNPIAEIKQDLSNFKEKFKRKQNYDLDKEIKKDFRDQMRKLRFNLLNSNAQVLLVTSTKPQEGKSALMQAISIVLSQGDSKVLIMDTNFHNNTLTRLFEAPKFLEVILDKRLYFDRKFVRKDVFPNVDIIGCKGGDYTPVEITKNDNFKVLIDYLKTVYDFVLLEGLALNLSSDSRELTSYADGVVTVFSSKSIIKQSDRESIVFLRTLEDKNLGAILNDVEQKDLQD